MNTYEVSGRHADGTEFRFRTNAATTADARSRAIAWLDGQLTVGQQLFATKAGDVVGCYIEASRDDDAATRYFQFWFDGSISVQPLATAGKGFEGDLAVSPGTAFQRPPSEPSPRGPSDGTGDAAFAVGCLWCAIVMLAILLMKPLVGAKSGLGWDLVMLGGSVLLAVGWAFAIIAAVRSRGNRLVPLGMALAVGVLYAYLVA